MRQSKIVLETLYIPRFLTVLRNEMGYLIHNLNLLLAIYYFWLLFHTNTKLFCLKVENLTLVRFFRFTLALLQFPLLWIPYSSYIQFKFYSPKKLFNLYNRHCFYSPTYQFQHHTNWNCKVKKSSLILSARLNGWLFSFLHVGLLVVFVYFSLQRLFCK